MSRRAHEDAAHGGDEAIDLRIHTAGLDAEEIAAVTSVVTAAVQAERQSASSPTDRRWQEAVAPLGRRAPAASAWRRGGC